MCIQWCLSVCIVCVRSFTDIPPHSASHRRARTFCSVAYSFSTHTHKVTRTRTLGWRGARCLRFKPTKGESDARKKDNSNKCWEKLRKKNAAPTITNIGTSRSKTETAKKQVFAFWCCCSSHRQRAATMRDVQRQRRLVYAVQDYVCGRKNGAIDKRKSTNGEKTWCKVKCGRTSCCSTERTVAAPHTLLDLLLQSPLLLFFFSHVVVIIRW